METKMFWQSCTLPIESAEFRGSEKDGSISSEYCKYCFQNGVFTSPGMTIDAMRSIVRTQMERRYLPEELIQMSIQMLPQLKRWRSASQAAKVN